MLPKLRGPKTTVGRRMTACRPGFSAAQVATWRSPRDFRFAVDHGWRHRRLLRDLPAGAIDGRRTKKEHPFNPKLGGGGDDVVRADVVDRKVGFRRDTEIPVFGGEVDNLSTRIGRFERPK
jgi:hypothetical protein